jgi:5-methylcytosine-specific restriction endonuclease McrA
MMEVEWEQLHTGFPLLPLRSSAFRRMRNQVLAEGSICEHCGGQLTSGAHGDHLISVKAVSKATTEARMTPYQGSAIANSYENIARSCPTCNLRKGAQSIGAFGPTAPSPKVLSAWDWQNKYGLKP